MKLQESSSSAVYRTLLKAFKNDPFLQREVKTWVVGDGERIDVEAQPSDRTRPMIKLTPTKGNTHIVDTCSLRSDFNVRVEMWLTSFSYLDMMDLWGQIERTIFSEANDARFQAAGVITTVPTMQDIQLIRDDYSTYGIGEIRMDMWQDRVA